MAEKSKLMQAPSGWKTILLQMENKEVCTFVLANNNLKNARGAIKHFHKNPKNPPMRFRTESNRFRHIFKIIREQ